MPVLQTADQRNLAWHEWGKQDGHPVLYFPGAGMAGLFPFGEEDAIALGARMIAVDRPGLGASDHDKNKSWATWQRDIEQLIAHLKIETPKAVGFSQGAPFAYALAVCGLVSAIAVVSGQDDLCHHEMHKKLPEPVSSMIDRAGLKPLEFEAEIAASASADWLMQMIETMSSEQDCTIYTHPSFAPRYRASLDEGFRQGTSGYARDTRLAMAPWPFRLEEISCPVDLWYGKLDTSPVHSPDFGSTLNKRLLKSRLHQIENEGSSILWTKSREILSSLLSAN